MRLAESFYGQTSTRQKSGARGLCVYVTNKSNLCIVGKKKSCWKATQTKTEVCFAQKSKRICRGKHAYMRGDQTSAYVKK